MTTSTLQPLQSPITPSPKDRPTTPNKLTSLFSPKISVYILSICVSLFIIFQIQSLDLSLSPTSNDHLHHFPKAFMEYHVYVQQLPPQLYFRDHFLDNQASSISHIPPVERPQILIHPNARPHLVHVIFDRRTRTRRRTTPKLSFGTLPKQNHMP